MTIKRGLTLEIMKMNYIQNKFESPWRKISFGQTAFTVGLALFSIQLLLQIYYCHRYLVFVGSLDCM